MKKAKKRAIKKKRPVKKWRKELKRKEKEYDPNKIWQTKKQAANRDLAKVNSGFVTNFLKKHEKTFPDKISDNSRKSGHLFVPETFSLLDNEKESFRFLSDIFYILCNQTAQEVTIDFYKCEKIDPDASACLDLIVKDFINYFEACRKRGVPAHVIKIRAENYDKDSIKRVLFSIGAFTNLKGFKINYPDIVTCPLKISENNPENSGEKEVEITNLVDYINQCVNRMGKNLTSKAFREFSQIIGEVLTNAEEHSTTPYRYSIGYFQQFDNSEGHFGYINFVIMNYGQTIYEKFKGPECENSAVKNRMEELSSNFTKKGFFSPRDFEEETLWTLYSLQEGVTSTNEKRGNGSIRFIDSFFKLKGIGEQADKFSKLKLLSGNSRIIFDGTYPIIETKKETGESFQLMAFNESGDIENKPDKNFVRFARNFFPGTILTSRIVIDDEDLKS
jgi:hypothetical protein